MNPQQFLSVWMICSTAIIIAIFSTKAFIFLDVQTKKHNHEVNGLRFFLAIGVAFHHFVYSFNFHSGRGWVATGYDINAFMGRFSVAIFFIISGYLFYNKISTKTDWRVFFIKRFLRIAPMALISSAICIFIAISLDDGSFDITKQICNIMYWFDAGLYNLRMNVSSVPNASLINAGVTWTLYWEWSFYFSLPFLSLLMKDGLRLPVVITIIAASYYFIPMADYKAACYAALFAAGFLAKELNFKSQNNFLISILPIALLLVMFYTGSSALSLPLIPLCFAFFVLCNNKNAIYGIFRNKGVTRLGEISYSIYILHGIAWYVLNISIKSTSIIDPCYLFISSMALILIVVICAFTYIAIERPFMKLLDRKNKIVVSNTDNQKVKAL
ncbi:acyltransferase family protein [Pseudenterobacter timonensis]|uniref:Acyltransferase family protein n=1 Tax=Pseudenterobacter timonensis TaxID=1755099 RepID=A0ABV4A1C4_9ENTR